MRTKGIAVVEAPQPAAARKKRPVEDEARVPVERKTREGDTDQVRTAVRFPMKLALNVATPDGAMNATTENISANGILFTGAHLPAVDSRIEFTIQMPANVMGTPEDVSIRCLGRVVRHQTHEGQPQAAAIIDEYFLRG